MQRQKTIAKWLAIILLLTSVVACYIVFGTSLGNKNDVFSPVAGADNEEHGESNLPSEENPSLPTPVYSQFPREGYVDGNYITQHIGGESNDTLKDVIIGDSTMYVIFDSRSEQHDVREKGLHLAMLKDGKLLGVRLVSSTDSYACSVLTVDGLMIVTKDEQATHIGIYDDQCEQIYSGSTAPYVHVTPYTDERDNTMLFVSDNEKLGVITIDRAATPNKSNFEFELASAEVKYAFSSEGRCVLLTQSARGIHILTFSANGGFIYKSELLNNSILQLIPTYADNKQGFAFLSLCPSGINVCTLSGDLAIKTTYTVQNAKNAVIFPNGENYAVLATNMLYGFCSHMEWQYSVKADLDDTLSSMGISEITYIAVSENPTQCVAYAGGHFAIAEFANGALSSVYDGNGSDVAVRAEGDVLHIIYNSSSGGFGQNDVFIASRLTA